MRTSGRRDVDTRLRALELSNLRLRTELDLLQRRLLSLQTGTPADESDREQAATLDGRVAPLV